MVKGEKKHTYTIDEKGGYKNPQPPILDLQCPTRGSCTNLEEEEGGEGGEDEGRRLRGGGKRGFNNTIVGWCRHTIKSRSEFALMREKMCEFKVRILENTELKCLGKNEQGEGGVQGGAGDGARGGGALQAAGKTELKARFK